MLGIQAAIGALNDVVDAPLDAIAKPRKPIPTGLVARRVAIAVAGGGALLGLGLSAGSGVGTLLVGACCLTLGWLYDLRLSRTALSWLPLSIALPLLPIHAWLGATGLIPGELVTLVPIGVLAGAGLALANGIVDVDRDAQSGRSAVVVALGRRRAWILQTAGLALAAGMALLLAPGAGSAGVLRWGGLGLGCLALAMGAGALASSRAGIRERGWELEAVGVAGLAIGWLAGLAAVLTPNGV